MAATLLDRLKIETRPAHDRIEAAIDIDARLSSRASYRALLARFWGFHRAWEDAAEAAIGDPAFFRPRRKVDLIARDLSALGLAPSAINALPLSPPLPMPTSAAAYGALYVVEGSTLGGAVIARLAERRLGLTLETGCAYFRAYGAATGAMWTALRARLLAMSSPVADDEILASADRTFAAMQEWLCGGEPDGALAFQESSGIHVPAHPGNSPRRHVAAAPEGAPGTCADPVREGFR